VPDIEYVTLSLLMATIFTNDTSADQDQLMVAAASLLMLAMIKCLM
jgi:hypothetical protein